MLLPIPVKCRDWPVIEPPFPMLPDRLHHGEVLHCSPVSHIAAWIIILIGVGLGASASINVNKFSLHAMYRARLIRAYLGASRERRRPNPFTGFDPLDNVQMHQLRNEAFTTGSLKSLSAFVDRLQRRAPEDAPSAALFTRLSADTQKMIESHVADTEPSSTLTANLLDDLNLILDTVELERASTLLDVAPPSRDAGALATAPAEPRTPRSRIPGRDGAPPTPAPQQPLHVLNMALNLVGGQGPGLAGAQGGDLHRRPRCTAAAARLGYRRSQDYGGGTQRHLARHGGGHSGAAANPNMGYNSSPALTFIMTLFNARLGMVARQSRPAGQRRPTRAAARAQLGPRAPSEALGLTDDDHPYVNLSDGGHFENLGLYEMVLRRCRLIVVSDAGGDPHLRASRTSATPSARSGSTSGSPSTFEDRIRDPPRSPSRPEDGARYCAVGSDPLLGRGRPAPWTAR